MLTGHRETLTISTIHQHSLGHAETISQETLDLMCCKHEKWRESNGRSGKKLNLFYKVLTGLNFSGRDISLCRLELCDLRHCNFDGTKMENVWLYGSDLGGAILDDSDASGSTFLSAHCESATFVNATLVGSCFMYGKLINCDFSGANLQKADFEHAEAKGASFDRSNVIGVDLTNLSSIDYSRVTNIALDKTTELPYSFSGVDINGAPFNYDFVDGRVRLQRS